MFVTTVVDELRIGTKRRPGLIGPVMKEDNRLRIDTGSLASEPCRGASMPLPDVVDRDTDVETR